MKSLGFVLAMVAMVPVFALIPACAAEVGEESEALLEAEAVEAPDLELESNVPGGGCATCTKSTFLGAGSCIISVVPGSACQGGTNYIVNHFNYENWKNCKGNSLFWKSSGILTTTECRSSAPTAYCPGFCN